MKIAVVGGIGSGKSEVMKKVASMGAATLSADEINASLLTSPDYIASLQSLFPTAVKDGVVDKHALAEIVFADETSRKALNALAHPLILKKIREGNLSYPKMTLSHVESLLRENRFKSNGVL